MCFHLLPTMLETWKKCNITNYNKLWPTHSTQISINSFAEKSAQLIHKLKITTKENLYISGGCVPYSISGVRRERERKKKQKQKNKTKSGLCSTWEKEQCSQPLMSNVHWVAGDSRFHSFCQMLRPKTFSWKQNISWRVATILWICCCTTTQPPCFPSCIQNPRNPDFRVHPEILHGNQAVHLGGAQMTLCWKNGRGLREAQRSLGHGSPLFPGDALEGCRKSQHSSVFPQPR